MKKAKAQLRKCVESRRAADAKAEKAKASPKEGAKQKAAGAKAAKRMRSRLEGEKAEGSG